MPLPHFLCIGAQKAGTSWFNRMLGQRDDVWTGPFKEMHFFNAIHVPDHRHWATLHVRASVRRALWRHFQTETSQKADLLWVERLVKIADKAWMFTEDWYRYTFDLPEGRGKTIGDVTPEYSTLPEQGVAHVKALMPEARIIYILRDPVARMCSHLKMMIARRRLDVSTFDRAAWMKLAEEPGLVQRGDYPAYLPRWERAYGDALLVLPFGALSSSPLDVMRRIEIHLGLSRNTYANLQSKFHATQHVDIPDYVLARLEERAYPARQFVADHLGRTFAEAMVTGDETARQIRLQRLT
jgi:hypothetical protein